MPVIYICTCDSPARGITCDILVVHWKEINSATFNYTRSRSNSNYHVPISSFWSEILRLPMYPHFLQIIASLVILMTPRWFSVYAASRKNVEAGDSWMKFNRTPTSDCSFPNWVSQPVTSYVQVIGETCDIVTEAVERYKAIILTEARIAKIFSQGHAKSYARDNGTIKGTLSALDIHLGEPCEKDGNHWPHLRMKESCKFSIYSRTTN